MIFRIPVFQDRVVNRLASMDTLLFLLALLPAPFLLARTVGTNPIADATDAMALSSTGRTGVAAVEVQTEPQISRTSGRHDTATSRTSTASWTRATNGSRFGRPLVSKMTNATFANPIEALLEGNAPSEGDTVVLSCIVYDPNILTVSWLKGRERLSTHDMLGPAADSQRMSVSYGAPDSSRRVFNLSIDFIRSEDSGEFMCRGLYQETSAVVDLLVKYVPEIHYPECTLNGKRKLVVTEGDNLRFECHSEKGVPAWHLIWFHQLNGNIDVISTSTDGQSELIRSAHSLVASRSINGSIFMCSMVCLSQECQQAKNYTDPRNCNIGPLIVNPRPPTETAPVIDIYPGVQIATEGDNIEMSCSTSLTDGNAAWFLVGDEPVDDHIQVSDDGSHMSIANVKENDTDLMACGVFCNNSLVTVKQVHLEVLRKDAPTTVVAEQTSVTQKATPEEKTTSPMPSSPSIASEGDSNSSGYGQEDMRKGLVIGTPTVIIFVVLVLLLLLLVYKFRRRTYQRAATSEVPDDQLAV